MKTFAKVEQTEEHLHDKDNRVLFFLSLACLSDGQEQALANVKVMKMWY